MSERVRRVCGEGGCRMRDGASMLACYCMQRARDGIPHNYQRQVAWATNTLTNWLNGNGPPPEVRRDRDFPSWRECQRHRLAQERRRKTKLLYYR